MDNKAQDDDQVMNLVELALDLPEQQRRAYLESACAHDSELFNQAWEYVHWEARMQGFLLDPLYPPPISEHPFEAGELLDGRFRILREVAQGGMGVVYEAMDERLERRIAIKCAKTGFRKRLPPEVRNAREISHPNVCKIFEIHTASTRAGDLDFLSMEFLEGETLGERLRRSALTEPEARLIAHQLCQGLAEAHRNQVIHGDLKSNNIILTTGTNGASRAVITDFGLARKPEASQRTMQTGPLGGTPDYMAPELWRGEKATVASDIYALGVILYELISGHRPSQSAESSANKFPPPPVHPKWDRTLTRCLEPDASRRYGTADDLARAFEPSYSRRHLLAAAAAILFAVGSAIFSYERATAPLETVRLAMLPFVSPATLAPLADNLLHNTAAQFAQLKSSRRTKLIVVPLANALRSQVDTVEKAKAAGATHVLRGSVQQENDDLVLHVFLTDTRSGVNVKEWSAHYAKPDFKYAPVALAGIVTGTFHLPPLTSAGVNDSARKDYLDGISAIKRDGGVDAALTLFERAAAADPGSSLIYAGLAEAQWFKYAITEDNLWLDRSTDALRQAENRNPDLAPVHRVAGLLKSAAGWYEQATAHFLRAIEMDPNNGDAYRRLGEVYEKNNQLDEALAAFERAVELDPQQYRNHRDLGAFYHQRADYPEAIRHFEKAVQLAPEEPGTHFGLALAYESLGQFALAESELRSAIQLRETPLALHALGVVLLFQGKDREAIPSITRALSLGAERYLWWMNLGTAYRRMGLAADSDHANRRGLSLAEAEMIKNPRSGFARSHLAYLCARLGDQRRAESEIAQALQQSPSDADTRWMAAVTYEALGKRNDTLSVLASSPVGVLADLSRWPDVADLHKDSRFKEMLASHGVK